MKSVEEIAEFIAARKSFAQNDWQVFDMSAARRMTDEMHRQYANGGEWRFNTPLPAQKCVFWDGTGAIMCLQNEGAVSAFLMDELNILELHADVRGRAAGLLDALSEDHGLKKRLVTRLGRDEVSDLITTAEEQASRKPASLEDHTEFQEYGEPATTPMLQCAAVMAEFCAFPIARLEHKPMKRPTRRRLKRLGVSLEVRTVGLSPANHKAEMGPHSPGARKALHFCRGHWRKSGGPNSRVVNGDLRTWIAGHWRGNPDYGIVLHDYVCRTEDVELRSALIS